MGLFTKKDPDGLPISYDDLAYEAWSKKALRDPVYKRRVLEKLMIKGVERWKEGKLDDVDTFLMRLAQLQECYENGLGGSVDKKAGFDCLMLYRELMEEYLAKGQLSADTINRMSYIWEDVADHYMLGEGCEKNAQQFTKYIMMALKGWNQFNDQYGISGVAIIRRLMSGYPYPMMDAKAYTLMATDLRFRGAEYGAYVMQEIESMAQMEDYQKLGSSLESDLTVLNKAAAAGNAFANYSLGKLYEEGKKVSKDPNRSIQYYIRAADTLAEAASRASVYYEWSDRSASARFKAQSKMLEQAALEKYPIAQMQKNTVSETGYDSVNVAEDVSDSENDTEYKGKYFTASDTPFSILDLPDVITGPYEVTYRKKAINTDSADYFSDHGDRVTIHVADIGMTGRSAQNSFGYFHW